MALPIAVTMGDPGGIGGELTLMAWQAREASNLAPFFTIDDLERLRAITAHFGWDIPITAIQQPRETCGVFASALPVLALGRHVPWHPGKSDPADADAVISCIGRAVALARSGETGGLVTNSIHKKSLYDAGFAFPGHTEYIGHLCGASRAVMMLANAELKVVPVTVHMALRDAVQAVSTKLIIETAAITARALKTQFGIARPRLAIAGLNPHAGENGSLGSEEIEIIAPAIDALRAQGHDVSGPWPPDTMFAPGMRQQYDVAICHYHDQALIPLKTLDMDSGVNVTLGLPIVRTSPDHGTALDIAGTGRARPDSLIAALKLAQQLAAKT